MDEFLFMLHSGLRYLVLLAGVVAILALVLAQRGTAQPGRAGTMGFRTFVGLLDLQVLIGLVVLLTRPFYGALIGHITMMVLALAVAHGTSIAYRRRTEERRTKGFLAAGVGICLVLIAGGILAIGRPIL